jgi:GntR family transcriptional regulator/MocR family aminotransferase
MSSFRSTQSTTPPQLVLGFGQISERAIEPAVAAIANLLS